MHAPQVVLCTCMLNRGACHVYTQEPAMSTHRNLPCLHTGTCHVYTQEPDMSTHRNLPCLHTGTYHVYTQEPDMSTNRNLTCLHTGTCHVYTQNWYYASRALKGFQYPLTNLKQLHSNIVQRTYYMKAFI